MRAIIAPLNDTAFVIREPLLDEPAVADGPWLESDSTIMKPANSNSPRVEVEASDD